MYVLKLSLDLEVELYLVVLLSSKVNRRVSIVRASIVRIRLIINLFNLVIKLNLGSLGNRLTYFVKHCINRRRLYL